MTTPVTLTLDDDNVRCNFKRGFENNKPEKSKSEPYKTEDKFLIIEQSFDRLNKDHQEKRDKEKEIEKDLWLKRYFKFPNQNKHLFDMIVVSYKRTWKLESIEANHYVYIPDDFEREGKSFHSELEKLLPSRELDKDSMIHYIPCQGWNYYFLLPATMYDKPYEEMKKDIDAIKDLFKSFKIKSEQRTEEIIKYFIQ